MKKFSILIIVLFISTFSFAQLGLGIKAGASVSNFPPDKNDIETILGGGYQLGAFARIGDKWHIQPEVYFTSKSGTINYDFQTVNIKQEIILKAVDVPILIGWKIIDPPMMNVRLQAGPVASFVSEKKFNVSFDGVKQDDPSEEYVNSYSDLNWGLQFGAGADFLFLSVDLRYELGLNNIYKNADGLPEIPFDNIKSNLLLLSVGWKFL